MRDWTDEELGALLTETFAAQEDQADDAVATRLAGFTVTHRRRLPTALAVAATVAAVIAGTTYIVDQPEGQVVPLIRPNSYAGHVQAATREATWMLALAPIPDGAVPLAGEPAGWRGTGISPAFATTGISREKWFSVAMSPEKVRSFLVPNTPQGLDRFGNIGYRVGQPNFAQYRSSTYSAGRGPGGAYTPPELVVEWTRVGDRTVIHAQVALAALRVRARETRVPTGVTSIVIRRYQARYLPAVRLTSPAEDVRIKRLVADFNSLVPMPDPMPGGLCPQGDRLTYRLTFVSPGAVVTAQFMSGCPSYVQVYRNGRELDQRLDPSVFTVDLSLLFRSG